MTTPSRCGAAPFTMNGTDGATGEDRGHRPCRVGMLMAPAQLEFQPELFAPVEIDAAAKLSAENGTKRLRGLLRDGEIERTGARLGEAILRDRAALEASKGRDERLGRSTECEPIAGLQLSEELVGAIDAVGGPQRKQRNRDEAAHIIVDVAIADDAVDVRCAVIVAAVEAGLQVVAVGVSQEAIGPLLASPG